MQTSSPNSDHQKKIFIFISICLISLNFFFSISALAQGEHFKTERPKLGLVLSGGGAKGFAHIGAIKVFEEAGLRFDYIGGTSMGSIIGGLYAIGYHPDTMMKIVGSQNWNNLMSDKIPRRFVPIEEKYNVDRFITTFPVRKRKLQMRQGLYNGQLIELLLAHYTSQSYQYETFNEFPTPFLCIGTDLENGESVILDRGILHRALRASMSIPSYFTPVKIDDSFLVDGGVVNNYPVQEVKDLGADIIVGVDVQSGLHRQDQLSSLVKIMDQVTSFYRMDANEKGRKNTDIYIKPDLGTYDVMSFNDHDSIVKLGEAAARKALPQLKKLADSLNAFGRGNFRVLDAKPLDSVFISSVQYRGLKNVSRDFLEGALQINTREWIQMNELTKGILRAYGSGFFETVNFHFLPDIEGVVLVIEVKEASSGILGAGIHYDSDYKVALLLNGTFKNVLYKGSKLFIDLNLGENSRFTGFYLIDRGQKPGFGLRFTTFSLSFNDYDNNNIVDVFRSNQNKLELFTQLSRGKTLQFRTGFEYEYIKIRSNLNPIISDKYNSYLTVFANWLADTYDKSSFPTKGIQLNLKAKYIVPVVKNWDEDFFSNALMFQMRFAKSTPINRRNAFQSVIHAGFTIKDDLPPPQHWFILGGQSQNNYFDGFIPFNGLRFIEEAGLYTLVGAFSWQYNVYRKFYITLKWDLGYIGDDFDEMMRRPDLYSGFGIAFGYDSFIGPVELSLMGSNKNSGMLSFINIGYWF
ncbi:MAG: patatin-like phospholipase family protein [Bacteroidetes bacterium]|nr:patatin-like phospholipase family protein [Bacteroidota bacterium]